jgi:hypothetical protein
MSRKTKFWHCAGDLHRAIGGQRPAPTWPASAPSPAVRAAKVLWLGTTAAAGTQAPRTLPTCTLPPLLPTPLRQQQPPPPTLAAGPHAPGSTGLTALRSCHRTVRGPADVLRPSTARRTRAPSTGTTPHPFRRHLSTARRTRAPSTGTIPHPFRRHVYLGAN